MELKPLPGGLKYAYLGPGKLKPRWDDPFIVSEVFNHGVVVVEDPGDGRILKVNGQRLKPYLGGVRRGLCHWRSLPIGMLSEL